MNKENSLTNYFRLSLYLLSYSLVIYNVDWRMAV